MGLNLDGKSFFVPGAFAVTKIIQLGGSALPVFNVGVIVGKQMKGTPYTAGTGSSPVTADNFIRPYSDVNQLIADYGDEGDCEITTFFNQAKKQGAGTIFVLGGAPTTKLSGGKVQNAAPADALTISSRGYGAQMNDIQLTIAASVHTIIPPKNVTFLTADSGTGKTVTVKNVKPYHVGETVYIVDNDYAAPVSKVVEAIDTLNSTLTFTVAVASSALIAKYARVFQKDTDNQEVSVALTTVPLVQNFYANSRYLSAAIFAEITLMPVTLAATFVGDLTGATKATSPAMTATDWQNVASNFPRWNEEFAIVNKVYMRVIGLVTSDAANQASFAALATTMRTNGKPVQVVTGAALSVADGSVPALTLALNSGDVQFAARGLDGLAAYKSLAGQLFGIRLANNVAHNQTNDEIVCSTVEKGYSLIDPTLETMVKAGAVVPVMTKTGYKVSQGLTTYQDQSTTFNTVSRKTYLVTCRDLADFSLRATLEVLDGQVGADGVTAPILAAIVRQVLETLKSDYGYIQDYKINRIYKQGNAFVVDRSVAIDSPTDFIGLIDTIIVS